MFSTLALTVLWVGLQAPAGAEDPVPRDRIEALRGDIAGLSVAPEVVGPLGSALEAIESEPDSAALWAELAMDLHAHSLFGAAAEAYRAALALDPDDYVQTYRLGVVELELGNREEGERLVRRTLELRPGYVPAWRRLGDVLLEAGDLEEARTLYERFARTLPKDPSGILGLARVALQAGEHETARHHAEAAIRLRPEDLYPYGLLAAALRGLGEREKAAEYAARAAGATERFADPWIDQVSARQQGWPHWVASATGYFRNGRAEVVIPRLETALRDHPEETRIAAKLVEGYLVTGRLEEASSVLDQALEEVPDDFVLYLHRAQLHRLRGEPDAALASVDRAIALNGAVWQPRVERARLLWSRGARAEAEEALDRALELGARADVTAVLDRAEMHMVSGRFVVAEGLFDEAAARTPGSARAVAGLVMARAENGDFVGAKAALARMPKDNDPRLRIARARVAALEAGAQEEEER